MKRNDISSAITVDRFMAKVIPEALTGCWLWTGAMQHAYGKFRINMRDVRAHRVSWEMHIGPIPDGLEVCHHCDTPLCVNPDHLFIGTHYDNMTDCKQKRRFKPHNILKTHCKHGHELSGENLYTYKSGRYCRECRKVQSRKSKESKK